MSKIVGFFNRKEHPVRFVILIIVIFSILFMALSAISIQVWEYTNTSRFCASACHEVHPEIPAAYQDSYHAEVSCVECHIGRVHQLKAMLIKTTHLKHLPMVIFNTWERPTRSESMRTSAESCERCHNAGAYHGDTISIDKKYRPDAGNTEDTLYMILKTGEGNREENIGYGIHWHVVSTVEFIATDETKQEIPWVRLTRADGTAVTYVDEDNPLTPEEVEKGEIHVMECQDCHNRKGHPYPVPSEIIDRSITQGRLSKDIPYLKKELLELLTAGYQSQEQALEAAGEFNLNYAEKYPDLAKGREEELEHASGIAQEFVESLIFEEPGITWEDFPDNEGHKYFPGCFRCHDNRHVNEEREAIKANCNLCHSIPQIVKDERVQKKITLLITQPPPSHGESSFLFDHRILANQKDCGSCHGEIKYGKDDSGFCASSTCHDTEWPRLDINREFTHPTEPMEGKHLEASCSSCHQGGRKPEYDCATCHTAPAGHFREDCASCHSPQGFKQSAANLVSALSGIPHETGGAYSNCMMCHDPKGKIRPAPGDHTGYRINQCTICHKP